MSLELLILLLEFGQRLCAFTLLPLGRQTCCRVRKREEGRAADPAVCEVSVDVGLTDLCIMALLGFLQHTSQLVFAALECERKKIFSVFLWVEIDEDLETV